MKENPVKRTRETHANASEIQAVLTLLAASPKAIARVVRGRSEQQLHRRPEAGAWSAQEIAAHLRACADVWGRSIGRMVDEDHPTIRYVSPRAWIKKTDYLEQSFGETLRAFAAERGVLLTTLTALRADRWTRGAIFTGATVGRKATVLTYATRIAEHEVRHLDQLRRTIQTVCSQARGS